MHYLHLNITSATFILKRTCMYIYIFLDKLRKISRVKKYFLHYLAHLQIA